MPKGKFERPSAETRFWRNTQKGTSAECWEWNRAVDTDGYGQFYANGKTIKAHQYSFELHFGSRDGLSVLHKCDNPKCVNPNHLFLGTPKDNVGDAIKKGRMLVGEKNPNAKLTKDNVQEIRKLYSRDLKNSGELAKRFGVSRTMILDIVKKKNWRDV
jgi:hypothetical protein